MTSSTKKRSTTFVLAFFFGILGAHRFYAKRYASAIVMLFLDLTIIGLLATSVWVFIDWVCILTGEFKDGDGNRVNKG